MSLLILFGGPGIAPSGYTFRKLINGIDANSFSEAVEVTKDSSITFTYEVSNISGADPIYWISLSDTKFGNLTSECNLPITISGGQTATCIITRTAEEAISGLENIGTVTISGFESKNDSSWYKTPPAVLIIEVCDDLPTITWIGEKNPPKITWIKC